MKLIACCTALFLSASAFAANPGGTTPQQPSNGQTNGTEPGVVEPGTNQPSTQQPPVNQGQSAVAALHSAVTDFCQSADSMALSGNLDEDFLKLMIPHHESAIAMSEAYLSAGTNADLVVVANTIIEAQIAEIEKLKALLLEVSASNQNTSQQPTTDEPATNNAVAP